MFVDFWGDRHFVKGEAKQMQGVLNGFLLMLYAVRKALYITNRKAKIGLSAQNIEYAVLEECNTVSRCLNLYKNKGTMYGALGESLEPNVKLTTVCMKFRSSASPVSYV